MKRIADLAGKKHKLVIGLLSGTSADGIDAALARVSGCGPKTSVETLAFLTMPDLQQIAHFVVADKLDDVAYESAAGPITPLDCLFGLGSAIADGNDFMAHKTGFTETSLRKRLQDAGFSALRLWTSPFNLWAEAYKPGDAA